MTLSLSWNTRHRDRWLGVCIRPSEYTWKDGRLGKPAEDGWSFHVTVLRCNLHISCPVEPFMPDPSDGSFIWYTHCNHTRPPTSMTSHRGNNIPTTSLHTVHAPAEIHCHAHQSTTHALCSIPTQLCIPCPAHVARLTHALLQLQQDCGDGQHHDE